MENIHLQSKDHARRRALQTTVSTNTHTKNLTEHSTVLELDFSIRLLSIICLNATVTRTCTFSTHPKPKLKVLYSTKELKHSVSWKYKTNFVSHESFGDLLSTSVFLSLRNLWHENQICNQPEIVISLLDMIGSGACMEWYCSRNKFLISNTFSELSVSLKVNSLETQT